MSALFKEVQEEVLKAFEEEIPSIYYSDKSQEEYKLWKRTMSRMYHDLMKQVLRYIGKSASHQVNHLYAL